MREGILNKVREKLPAQEAFGIMTELEKLHRFSG